MCHAILTLEDAVLEVGSPKILKQLMDDVGTNVWPTVRIIFIRGTACNWDHNNTELLNICFSLYAGPLSTKPVLENPIGWVKDKVQRGNKNMMASNWTKYTYNLTCPYAATGGVKQCRPNAEDFLEYNASPLSDTKVMSQLRPFKADFAAMGDGFPTAKKLGKFRVAGRSANKISAIAHAYTAAHAGAKFADADDAWTSSLPT